MGLTGGIASGKSTVAAILREQSAPIIDADALARRVVQPGTPALAEIVARFGSGVLLADGRLDRKAMGDIVFSNSDARAALNSIVHPRIASESKAEIAAHQTRGTSHLVYEAALIVENNLTSWMDGLIVVSVSPAVQLQRLMERDGIEQDAAQARINSQLPLADKVAAADYVIDNSGVREQTRAQTIELWTRLRNG